MSPPSSSTIEGSTADRSKKSCCKKGHVTRPAVQVHCHRALTCCLSRRPVFSPFAHLWVNVSPVSAGRSYTSWHRFHQLSPGRRAAQGARSSHLPFLPAAQPSSHSILPSLSCSHHSLLHPAPDSGATASWHPTINIVEPGTRITRITRTICTICTIRIIHIILTTFTILSSATVAVCSYSLSQQPVLLLRVRPMLLPCCASLRLPPWASARSLLRAFSAPTTAQVVPIRAAFNQVSGAHGHL